MIDKDYRDYYVVLHGAKKNVGDFLIRDRAKKLLKHIRFDRDLIEFPAWEPLDDKLDIVNSAKALIIMGGPAINSNVYPNIFPLTTNLDDIKVPIVLMGVGSYVYPVSQIYNYKLSKESKKFLNKCSFISVRDLLTKNLLLRNGIKKVTMSGCPAWYDLEKINDKFNYTTKPNTIILSSPQKKYYFPQFLKLVQEVKNNFLNSKLIITFNRGYREDKYTNKRESSYMIKYYNILKNQGYNIVDLSSNLELFLDHLKYDMHIGYRLHTHINFLSNRKISYLLSEDSRGYGHCQTLSLPIFKAYGTSILQTIFPTLQEGLFKRALLNLAPYVKLRDDVIFEVIEYIKYDMSIGFVSFKGLDEKMRNNFEVMKNFLKELP